MTMTTIDTTQDQATETKNPSQANDDPRPGGAADTTRLLTHPKFLEIVRAALIRYGRRKHLEDDIPEVQCIVHGMSNNPAFPTPQPALSVISAAVSDLQAAETVALTRVKGSAAARNDKRAVLKSLLEQVRGYVQMVADATPENGATIIQSAGLAVRKLPTHAARSFTAKQGAVSGTAKVYAVSAARRASYEWQYSTDGGKTWLSAPVTLQAKATFTGLAAGSTAMFRYRAVTKAGEGDWSQPVALLVK